MQGVQVCPKKTVCKLKFMHFHCKGRGKIPSQKMCRNINERNEFKLVRWKMSENRGMTSTISYKQSLLVLEYSLLPFLPATNSDLRQAFHRSQKLTG